MSIGEDLAQARRQAGLTVAQVSQRTRIRQTIIRGLESDDYSACGGDFYARGHIRSIAKVVGTDSGPLIQEYDTAHRAPGAQSAVSMDELLRPAPAGRGPRPARPGRPTVLGVVLLAALAMALLVALGFVAYDLTSASGQAEGAHHPGGRSGTRPAAVASPRAGAATPSVSPSPSVSAAAAVQTLTPVSAAAFGPAGPGQGDNPQLAPRAIDGDPATAWHTDWYTTARFGNLYSGTGLLLDMGRTVTITTVRMTLGGAPGTDCELRIGAVPALAGLPPVADAANAAGPVVLRPATPVLGRYVLIWFTSLPPDPAGTFQADLSGVSVQGHA